MGIIFPVGRRAYFPWGPSQKRGWVVFLGSLEAAWEQTPGQGVSDRGAVFRRPGPGPCERLVHKQPLPPEGGRETFMTCSRSPCPSTLPHLTGRGGGALLQSRVT